MIAPIWTRATVRLAPHSGHDPRYLLHQAICTLWDGAVRPVWRAVRERDDAEIVVLSRDMMTGRPRGRWGSVEGVQVGPVHVPGDGPLPAVATVLRSGNGRGGRRHRRAAWALLSAAQNDKLGQGN